MSISKLCKDLKLPFENPDIFKCALTHSSFSNENSLPLASCNERLEFLGDAVLKICISDFLYKKLPEAREGELTKIRAQVVSDKILADFAKKIGLDKCLILGAQEEKMKGREKPSILACAFEAFLGLLYLELGLECAKEFILENFTDEIETIENEVDTLNPKALLQEYTQAQTKSLPVYRTLSENGEAHKKTFEVGVYYNEELLASGFGTSKKEAQQDSAKKALLVLGLLKE